MVAIIFAVFFILAFLSLPISFSLLAGTIVPLVSSTDLNAMVVVQRLFTGMNSFPMMAIPFFILAGGIMEKGGVSRRLVNLASALVGWMPGGLAVVTMLASAFFGAISGSSSATAAAIGGIMVPFMLEAGYDLGFTLTTVACAGYLGVIIPPSIPMVSYGLATGIDVGALFMAGFIPGIMLVVLMSLYCVRYGLKNSSTRIPFDPKKVGPAFLDAIWALIMPIIILGGIYSGLCTPTEAGALACVYGLIIGFFVYKELSFKKLIEIFKSSVGTIAMILFIIAAASGFGWIMAWANIPSTIAQFIMSIAHNKYVFLLLINVLLLFVGIFMDTSAAILIMAPIFYPMLDNYGISQISFAIIMIVNLAIGVCTPPLGLNLFVAAGIKKVKVDVLINRHLLAYILLSLIGIALLVFFPGIAEFLPGLLK